MQQDRATAIAGTLGKGPAVIPMTVTLQSTRDDGAASKRTFTFNVANDQVFTPLLAYVAMFNTLSAYERQFGAATFSVKSRAQIKGHGDLTIEDVFTGDNAVLGAVDGNRRPDHDAARQRRRTDHARAALTSRSTPAETPRTRHDRARLARRIRAPRGPHGAAQGPHAQLSRRGKDLDGARSRFPRTCPAAVDARHRRPAAERHGTARRCDGRCSRRASRR